MNWKITFIYLHKMVVFVLRNMNKIKSKTETLRNEKGCMKHFMQPKDDDKRIYLPKISW